MFYSFATPYSAFTYQNTFQQIHSSFVLSCPEANQMSTQLPEKAIEINKLQVSTLNRFLNH